MFSQLEFVPENAIAQDHWLQAFKLTSSVDEDDIAFVALAIHLDAVLWTGDMRLIKGLVAQGFEKVVTRKDIIHMRDI